MKNVTSEKEYAGLSQRLKKGFASGKLREVAATPRMVATASDEGREKLRAAKSNDEPRLFLWSALLEPALRSVRGILAGCS